MRSLGSGLGVRCPQTARLSEPSAWSPRPGAGDGFSSPGLRVRRSPGELPARSGSRPWLPRRARSPRAGSPRRLRGAASAPGGLAPEVGVYSSLGSEKLQLLTANGAVMTGDGFYSSAAFPCCRLSPDSLC